MHSRVCEIERKQISSKQTTNWLGRLTEWRKIGHMVVNRFYPKRASLTTAHHQIICTHSQKALKVSKQISGFWG
jgi:hypothetical protein